MADSERFSPPEFKDWSIPAVRLLHGVVYSEEPRVWDALLRSRSALDSYFSRLGLLLVVDEPEGYAFLRQWADDEWPDGWEALPRLMRRIPLGYGPTLLAVLLREELRRFEEEDIQNERCVVEAAPLFDQWKVFFATDKDEVRQYREYTAAYRKLEDLGFVKRFSDSPESWEIRRILKARLSVAELERLKEQLITAHGGANNEPTPGGSDE
jgi:hypothetical protein